MAATKARRQSQAIGYPRRGDVWLVDFNPTVASEIQKTRPALVIQNDIANEHSPITIVAAITSKFGMPPYPTEVVMEPAESGLGQRSAALFNQVRSVDRQRLIRRLGKVNAVTMDRVNRAIKISLGLVET